MKLRRVFLLPAIIAAVAGSAALSAPRSADAASLHAVPPAVTRQAPQDHGIRRKAVLVKVVIIRRPCNCNGFQNSVFVTRKLVRHKFVSTSNCFRPRNIISTGGGIVFPGGGVISTGGGLHHHFPRH